jgi:hypothetical protein
VGSKRSSITDSQRIRNERHEVQSTLGEHEAGWLDRIFLLAIARERVIAHRHSTMLKSRVKQLRDPGAPRGALLVTLSGDVAYHCRAGAGLRFCLHHERQLIEELSHLRRQRTRQLLEGAADVGLERRRGETFDERAAEVQRAQLREREPGFIETAERAMLERPESFAVVHLVIQREPGGLERFEIPANRPRTHPRPRRKLVDRHPARCLEIAQDRPLANDFGVAGHRSVTQSQAGS